MSERQAFIWWLGIFLAAIPFANAKGEKTFEEILDIARNDQRAIIYDNQTLLPLMQGTNNLDPPQLVPVGYNLAGSLDRTGSMNNEPPWRHPGGLTHTRGVIGTRMLWVPPGEHIKLWYQNYQLVGGLKNGLPWRIVVGDFPVGTISAEWLKYQGRTFKVRTREKVGPREWATNQELISEHKPPGYVAVTNCVACHEDIRKHSFVVDDRRDWYSTMRGLEPGGPIHWHPFAYRERGNTTMEAPMAIRDNVKHLVRWYPSRNQIIGVRPQPVGLTQRRAFQ